MDKHLRTAAPFIGVFAAGIVGMLFVGQSVGIWYANLNLPPFTPPTVAFPVVWTFLYLITATACAIVWRKEPQNDHTEGWVRYFFVQLFINAGWVIFFFGFHSITVAFVDNFILVFIVLGLTASAWEIDRTVTYLMLPYLLWVVFALYLTMEIWSLN